MAKLSATSVAIAALTALAFPNHKKYIQGLLPDPTLRLQIHHWQVQAART